MGDTVVATAFLSRPLCKGRGELVNVAPPLPLALLSGMPFCVSDLTCHGRDVVSNAEGIGAVVLRSDSDVVLVPGVDGGPLSLDKGAVVVAAAAVDDDDSDNDDVETVGVLAEAFARL